MATATGIPEMTLVDLGTDLLDTILRRLGVAPRDHCAAASACTTLRSRYLDEAKNPLLRVFEAGKREAPTGRERRGTPEGQKSGALRLPNFRHLGRPHLSRPKKKLRNHLKFWRYLRGILQNPHAFVAVVV